MVPSFSVEFITHFLGKKYMCVYYSTLYLEFRLFIKKQIYCKLM